MAIFFICRNCREPNAAGCQWLVHELPYARRTGNPLAIFTKTKATSDTYSIYFTQMTFIMNEWMKQTKKHRENIRATLLISPICIFIYHLPFHFQLVFKSQMNKTQIELFCTVVITLSSADNSSFFRFYFPSKVFLMVSKAINNEHFFFVVSPFQSNQKPKKKTQC